MGKYGISKIISPRRGIVIGVVLITIYIIGVLVIARRIVATPDSFALDDRLKNHGANTGRKNYKMVSDERKTDNFRDKTAEYEQWIRQWNSGIVESLGQYGKPAKLWEKNYLKGVKALEEKALNVVLSDKISLSRKLPDVRDPLCANVTYDSDLPSASVIIIFFNEPWSVLLRTVQSVLNGSPEKFLREIILVDDHSDEEELKGRLDYYIETYLPTKVKIIRLSKRSGLIRARLSGAKNATGDVLVFLDAHCEVIVQWLEPLLQRIKDKRNAVLVPIIDVINEKTLEYGHGNAEFFQVGGFTWAGHFTWINIQDKEIKSRSTKISPVASPTMAGGLFAIDRKYFWKIGSYDDQMDGWGGENLEISFRIWQCGGSLETVPCSRVGHIFRDFHPYKFPEDKDTHGINTARLVYTWMDEYKRLFLFLREEFAKNKTAIGDFSDRLELRKRLKCKNFKWYLDNVYPEKFIPDENVVAHGRVKLRHRNLCLDSLQQDEDNSYDLGIYSCHDKLMSSQFFSLTNAGALRRETTCATIKIADGDVSRHKVKMMECQNSVDADEWVLTKKGKIVHVATGLCLDGTGMHSDGIVFASSCSDDVPDQFWQFDFNSNKTRSR